MLRTWSLLARLFGGGAILFGFFAGSHAPTDIQLGIVTTSVIGGAILCLVGVGLLELNRLQAGQRELMALLTQAPASAPRPNSFPADVRR
ncbi:hypothetical protein [Lichenifustis flavocetrariae]|uniref:Uncharacterized protein n=1 Tax=Lichenifustis flavocetrariae TaxID=2949735 RepID=A0AA42CJU1_9HYPH|nr:hypothetical protein [Lichenifustis flavocetrariae]MCW6508461.1 hypothetical protein [Lichenifustis flavocetrariae]